MLDPDALLAHDFGETRAAYTARDAILYALGVGLPDNPLDTAELRFMDETDLAILPTFAVTLASPGMWLRDERFGIDFTKLVHISQSAWFETPLPAAGEIVGTARIKSLTDRGGRKGAVLTVEREIRSTETSALYCRLDQTLLLRGDGGFGGAPTPRSEPFPFDTAPDVQAMLSTSPKAALVYRLSGDWNPLHLRPEFARKAGFDKPILHGLASYGMAGQVLSRALGRDAADISHLSCRFSGVVVPGETLSFQIWKAEDGSAHFQAASERRKALDDGRISWRDR
ncbi:MaoC/PaaZ C-terminal domain-containing protein [Hyphomonas sp.]|uniref:MaoC/PaaZ C-terminal domain-containing protein n=1 Tax=Hyphomonas sp. TaxID=87 RepID=UPI003F71E2BB